MSFLYHHQPVTCCGDCPRNKEIPNPLWTRLPPVHYCIDVFDPTNINGKVILFPLSIPKWCPHDAA